MKVAITGSHGLIARHLLPELRAGGHDVVAVVRGEAGAGEISWDPAAGRIDATALEGLDAVIHLAGVGIAARRWNAEHRRAVLDSRVQGTSLMARTLAGLTRPPSVLVSASAIGYYGDRDDELLSESSPSGTGYLADVCRQWESAAAPAAVAGIRTVVLRTGIVLAGDGGALAPQLPLFRFGLGGRLGRGRQWVSWISIDDEVGAILAALDDPSLSGPVNLVAPAPVTNAEFTTTLGRVLGRPTILSVPAPALQVVLGPQMAKEMLLASQRVEAAALERIGYPWRQPRLEGALRAVLGRP